MPDKLQESLDAYEAKFGIEFPCYGIAIEDIPRMVEDAIKAGEPLNLPEDVLI